MRIAQVVAATASEFERKAQKIDFAALSGEHQVEVIPLEHLRGAEADVAHVYGPAVLPRRAMVGVLVPYVASGKPSGLRSFFRRVPQPARVITPVRGAEGEYVPEAVDEAFYAVRHTPPSIATIGSFSRPAVTQMLERTIGRIQRFRDDVQWIAFSTPPTPEEIASVTVWADPAVDESDYDGFVAEAIACGVPVVAARTAINAQRLEKGRIGFLVPPRDPNEMTHAILTALFKPELAEEREAAARQTASKFRVRQRTRVLLPLYEAVVR